MGNDDIVYEDLKIKNFNDIVIPEPFQLLYEAETHYFNLNSENFEETVNFYQNFITNGPGETQEDNFKYLLKLFINDKEIVFYSDNLHFQMIQTLNNIFHPTIRTDSTRIYSLAYLAGITLFSDLCFKPKMRGQKSSDELSQIMLDDDSLLISNEFDELIKDKTIAVDLPSKIISTGNLEIIRLFEQKGIKYDDLLSESFESRNSDLITWLLENYQQKKVDLATLSNIKSILFCLENNLCLSYYNLIKIYYESKFKTILEYMVKYNLDIVEHDIPYVPGKSESFKLMISNTLQNKRYDYFNILYDLGFHYSNGSFLNPLTFLIENKIRDLDLMKKVYQLTQRNMAARFKLSDIVIPDILSDMDLLKFFLERKIFTPILSDILKYCGLEEMKYIFDNFQSFDVKEFNSLFSNCANTSYKTELIEYIVKNKEVDLTANSGFYLMKFAFLNGHIDLIKYLLDKKVILFRKELKEQFKYRTKGILTSWNIYSKNKSPKKEDKEEDDDEYEFGNNPKYNYYNVMDEAKHDIIEAYQLILENGGKSLAVGSDNCKTLLDYHSMNGNFEIVKVLVEHGARIMLSTLKLCSDFRSLYFLIDHSDENFITENLELLINNDEKPSGFLYFMKNHSLDILNSYGILSCLSKSLQVKNESVCIYILKNLDFHCEDYYENIPDEYDNWLIKSIKMNSSECVRLLLDFMEKYKLLDGYFTPRTINLKQSNGPQSRESIIPDYYLHATKQNNTEIVQILIEHKVPINNKSNDFIQNALFWAAVRQNKSIIDLLLSYGYDKLSLSEEDLTLFHIPSDFLQLISK